MKSPDELERIAKAYVSDRFPSLSQAGATRSERQAKTPGSACQHVFDFTGAGAGSTQRVRLVLDGEGKVIKVTASR